MVEVRRAYRLAVVLWNGVIGGAEVHSVALAKEMRRMGVDATVLFIEDPQPLAARLSAERIPHRQLGLTRGRDVLRHPCRYAAEVARTGPDGALLLTCGYMGAALRAGGYSGAIVAVEHGDILEAWQRSPTGRALWRLSRMAGARADDVEVAVSDFVLERMRQYPHAAVTRRIYNGVDLDMHGAATADVDRAGAECVVAFAARLIRGKGTDHLLEAFAQLPSSLSVKLRIAGMGPELSRLEELTRSLNIGHAVEFAGLTHDMPRFWQAADIAVVPSCEFTESCPVTALEAMAAGRPVVATRNGGLPELMVDGETGTLVPSGDVAALARALTRYAGDEKLRRSHGAAARACVEQRFLIGDCARRYLDLFEGLATRSVLMPH